jgi:flagellin
MSLGVLNNINAIYAENNLNNTSSSLSKVLNQLSSGSKISSGADDAAGLSLVNGLQANSMALSQSETNAQEGVGLLTVADGALSQVTNLLNRAVTLATEASNGTLNTSQDAAANQEYQSILSEISNIGSTTTYNNQAVFNTSTDIYTGDSSAKGSSITQLNIRSLSSANLGDTGGTMSYSNGTNNVFIDLSKNGTNAAATDSLGVATATTTISVNYLSKGANGAAVNATANISVGAGTNYANTAQGLINAVNNSGLGVTASFGTAAQAGSASTAAATAGSDTNSLLETGATDTGIILSGAGIGVNTDQAYQSGELGTVPATYSNGAGEIGTLTTSSVNDTLGGTLSVVDTNGATHSIALGVANSTDTLANLAATIDGAGYGVTATINTSNVTNAAGTFGAGTVLTFTSASSAVTVAGTGITDAGAAATSLTPSTAISGGLQTAAGTTFGSITANGASDTLTGVLNFAASGTVGNHTAFSLNLDGGTLTSLFGTGGTGGSATAALAADNITATTNTSGTAVIFTETGASSTGATMSVSAKSAIQDSVATTGTPVVAQSAAPANNANFGTVTVTNANDSLTAGTITVDNQVITLGTSGSTDNLTDLAAYINSQVASGTGTLHTSGINAAVNSAGTQLILSGTTAANDYIYGSGVTSSLSLTGTPITNAGNATTMGTLSLATGQASSAALTGTLSFGTENISLGAAPTSTTAGTATLAELAQTINNGTYGVTAKLNASATSITFTTTDSADSLVTPPTLAVGDPVGGGGTNYLTWSTANQGVTTSQYYSVGISGNVNDTSTGGGTSTIGLTFNRNGSSGVATMSYSDTAGQSLANTDLATQIDAETTLTDLNKAISDVAAQDGYIGAQINTLNSVGAVLSTQGENVTSAQNAVQATDYASATSNMSKYQILSQTGISALAQANSMQQEVTKLLQ